jgi:hypothetical protein
MVHKMRVDLGDLRVNKNKDKYNITNDWIETKKYELVAVRHRKL